MLELTQSSFDELYEIMEEAFPREERRTYEQQKLLFEREEYHVYGVREGAALVAFIAVYELEKIRFVEHLATVASTRGSGVGKSLFQECLQMDERITVLEVEKPENEMAQRRINFYRRLGGHLYQDIAYVQPPFHEDVEPLPLLLMSWPDRLSKDEVQEIIHTMYTQVYHWTPKV